MYIAAQNRYEMMIYNRCGQSGLKLPAISLGLWHNFGGVDAFENSRAMARCAFDLGITHFDLANNYGPPYGSAETTFGEILRLDFAPYRDEMVISTKAGWDMWPGPYGDFGSRKYLIASLDQSLKRMGLDYVDIFRKRLWKRLCVRLIISYAAEERYTPVSPPILLRRPKGLLKSYRNWERRS
jgi:L-glyceraldehyde 3-phosphate reductase